MIIIITMMRMTRQTLWTPCCATNCVRWRKPICCERAAICRARTKKTPNHRCRSRCRRCRRRTAAANSTRPRRWPRRSPAPCRRRQQAPCAAARRRQWTMTRPNTNTPPTTPRPPLTRALKPTVRPTTTLNSPLYSKTWLRCVNNVPAACKQRVSLCSCIDWCALSNCALLPATPTHHHLLHLNNNYFLQYTFDTFIGLFRQWSFYFIFILFLFF